MYSSTIRFSLYKNDAPCTEIGEGHLAYYKEKEERGGEGCKSSLFASSL